MQPMPSLEELASSLQIDLEKLDQLMLKNAKEQPDSIEADLIRSNLSKSNRLRIGCLMIALGQELTKSILQDSILELIRARSKVSSEKLPENNLKN